MPLGLLSFQSALPKTSVMILAIVILAGLDVIARVKKPAARYAVGVGIGVILAFGLVNAAHTILGPDMPKQGQLMALGILFIIIAWRLLFGSWEASTKATVLGTFVLLIAVHIILRESPMDRVAHMIAIGVAAIPAVVWSLLFLPYHRERRAVVLCMVFAGMLSTIPILFYDALVRHQVQLHFFLFRVIPESFSSSAQRFVVDQWPGIPMLHSSLLAMFVSFLLVGVIEEGSKLWVLWRTGRQYATSIDDVMQMAILVAIGFAFAENVTNTGYFLGFVREYLMTPGKRDFVAFFGNVAGRSVLTSMVHIASTGIMGYYLGLGLFAGPVLQDEQSNGVRFRLLQEAHDLLGIPRRQLYRRLKILTGFVLAIVLHATSNFLVSLPDVLPGNPRTVGDLLGSGAGSPLNYVALLLFPTLFYVVGGFSVLTWLFNRKRNMKERGHLMDDEVFVTAEAGR